MKRWIAWALILTLLCGLAGCKSVRGEDSAMSDTYIEGESHEMSGDVPEKVTDWELYESLDPSQKQPAQPTEKPAEQPEEENSSEEETPADQPQKEEKEPEKTEPEQKPQDEPDQSTVTEPEEEPEQVPEEEEPEEDPEEDFEEDPEEEFEEEQEEEPTVQPVTPSVKPQAATELKIVSYNVRCANDGTGKTIKERAVRFKKVMDQYDPDIMGLQEVVPEWLGYLKEDFGGKYSYINQWRATSSKESTPIFWKKDKFTLVESGHFWLSDTPDKESKATSWGAKHYRICMWVKLKAKATGKTFLFMNTHFDTKEPARSPSAWLISDRAKEMGGFTSLAVFCTGDFNMKQGTEAYNIMYNRFKDVNKELENLQTPTSNGYHTAGKTGNLIDFCFYSPGLVQPQKYQIIDEYVNGGYVSDHCGLYIEAKVL